MFYFFNDSDPYQNNFYLEQVERAHSSNTGLIEQKLDCFFFVSEPVSDSDRVGY